MTPLQTITDLPAEMRRPFKDNELREIQQLNRTDMYRHTEFAGEALLKDFQRLTEELPKQVEAIVRRLMLFTPEIKYNPEVILLASLFCDRFGICTMWSHTLAIESQRLHKTLGIVEMVNPILFGGVPTEEGYHKLWIAQKSVIRNCETNRLDTAEEYIYSV